MATRATVDELSLPAKAYANALDNGLSEAEALAVAQEQLCQQAKAANRVVACPACKGRHRPHTCGKGKSQLQSADVLQMPKKPQCVTIAVPQMTSGRGRAPPPPPPPPPPLPPSSQPARPTHSTAPPPRQPHANGKVFMKLSGFWVTTEEFEAWQQASSNPSADQSAHPALNGQCSFPGCIYHEKHRCFPQHSKTPFLPPLAKRPWPPHPRTTKLPPVCTCRPEA